MYKFLIILVFPLINLASTNMDFFIYNKNYKKNNNNFIIQDNSNSNSINNTEQPSLFSNKFLYLENTLHQKIKEIEKTFYLENENNENNEHIIKDILSNLEEDSFKKIESIDAKPIEVYYYWVINKTEVLLNPAVEETLNIEDIQKEKTPSGKFIYKELFEIRKKEKSGKYTYIWDENSKKFQQEKTVYFYYIPILDIVINISIGYIDIVKLPLPN